MIQIAEIGLTGSFGPFFYLLQRSDIIFDKKQLVNSPWVTRDC